MRTLVLTAAALLVASLFNVFLVLHIAAAFVPPPPVVALDPIIAQSLDNYYPMAADDGLDPAMRDTLRTLWRTRHLLAVCEVSK